MEHSLQRASLARRISAWLFDGILLVVLAVLCAWGIAAAVDFDGRYDQLVKRYDEIAQEYGLDMETLNSMAYSELTAEERLQVEQASDALSADGEAVRAYQMVANLMILIVSFGALISHLALEFAAPLALGDGRTLGKKIFGVALMRSDGVKVGHVQMFVRAVLGKYAVETMLPIMVVMMFLIGSVDVSMMFVVVILFSAQMLMLLCSQNRTLIHDLLASTVAVDYASQMIFPTKEAMIAYKQQAHEKKVSGGAL